MRACERAKAGGSNCMFVHMCGVTLGVRSREDIIKEMDRGQEQKNLILAPLIC